MSNDPFRALELALADFRRQWSEQQRQEDERRTQVAALASERASFEKSLARADAETQILQMRVRQLTEDLERAGRDRRRADEGASNELADLRRRLEERDRSLSALKDKLDSTENRLAELRHSTAEEKTALLRRLNEFHLRHRDLSSEIDRRRRESSELEKELRGLVALEEKLKFAQFQLNEEREKNRHLAEHRERLLRLHEEPRQQSAALTKLKNELEGKVRLQNGQLQQATLIRQRLEHALKAWQAEAESWRRRFLESNSKLTTLSQELTDLKAAPALSRQAEQNLLARAEKAEGEVRSLHAKLQDTAHESQNWRRRALEAEREQNHLAEKIETLRRSHDRERRELEDGFEHRLADARRTAQSAALSEITDELQRQREILNAGLREMRRGPGPAPGAHLSGREHAAEKLKKSIRQAHKKTPDAGRLAELIEKLSSNLPPFEEKTEASAERPSSNPVVDSILGSRKP